MLQLLNKENCCELAAAIAKAVDQVSLRTK